VASATFADGYLLETLTRMDDQVITVASRLFWALLAGGIIGFERTYHGRPAGFRTHILVCSSSTLLVLVSVYQWQLLSNAPLETLRIDPTRMAQGIMTGIGFLGAGVIIKERFAVRGLTTAASIWITAAIGVVIGMGFYSAAGLGVALTLGALGVFRWVEAIMPALRYAKLTARFQRQNQLSLDELCAVIRAHDISSGSPSYQLADEGKIFEYSMTIRTHDARNLHYLSETLGKMDQVKEFSIIPTGD
jgi:putative Mg2+ transporter-C (MgtC) family protein